MAIISISEAAAFLKNGAVVAYPTESMYGLGCDPGSRSAVTSLLKFKHRSEDKGLLLVAGDFSQLEPYIAMDQVSKAQWCEVWTHWPGFKTYIFPASVLVPGWITGKHSGIALRLSSHPTVIELCAAFGGALVSTSANYASQPPIIEATAIVETFPELAGVVEGAVGGYKKASTLQDVLTGIVYREGD